MSYTLSYLGYTLWPSYSTEYDQCIALTWHCMVFGDGMMIGVACLRAAMAVLRCSMSGV
jgi:hypothetical protein